MGFWAFVFITVMLIPLTMVALGLWIVKRTESRMHMKYGYKSALALKNKNTWEYAHKLYGMLLWMSGTGMAVITIVIMLVIMKKELLTIGIAGAVLLVVPLVLIGGAMLATEIQLRNRFNKDGSFKDV